MAFSSHLVSILVCLASYQTVIAHPWSAEVGRPQVDPLSIGPKESLSSTSRLSTSCQLATSGLLAGDFGRCASILELVSIFDTKDSLVSPINNWVTSACSSTPCGEEGLAAASQMIRTGCQNDLKDGSIAAVAIYSIITHYKQARDMFCTQYKENLNYCLPSVLGNVESQSGETITMAEVSSLIAGKFTPADQAFLSVPKETYCNACGQAIVRQSASMIDAIHQDPAGIEFNYTSSFTVSRIIDICGPPFESQELDSTVQVARPGNDEEV
ncbi:hypothetical protein PCANC_24822 [Puccinia coronata f. sp. avenae]|uniref:DUF7729 domain-containing protein n=1 Tax=Puccinia coronata f. sp. avenae TaxID=200324 RepID=A0A2N5TJL8_9BASI|nr:hypothetical protein PCANC_24822 [Puccinia coronata f. sp. avenae]